ncbi:unnamed protein product [Cyclocybe aegerita]|uniref:FAD-binding PCMH-type domain-containing protein n=1 Tax=Cyclocybe aegerita TaxID=1973307 RepID=A0A8S0VZH3_CYCAE|nr:unnamed protein product [Cyclocybe aegerita]
MHLLHHLLPLLLTSVLYTAAGPTPAASQCRCLYGEPCWPSQSTFSALSDQLSQPILHPVPPESACYPPSSPSGNCSALLSSFDNGDWRADQPGAMQLPNFQTYTLPNGTIEACYMNVSLGVPCEQGSVPPIGVDARTVEDVRAAVVFARQNNLRLVVKNTGHDYLGRSTGRGAFMLWTHHLKNMTFDQEFVPDGAPSSAEKVSNAVTLGSGVAWHEAYDFVQERGRFILGGISVGGTVGAAGGWIMGAGHSAFAPTFGLGVDNVLQFTIVLASGQHIAANAYQNTDLFWALRGGGGGTYGVVTSVTYRTHPVFSLSMAVLTANFSSMDIAQSVITKFIKSQPAWSDKGWGGYSSINSSSFQLQYVAPNVSTADMNATLSPFVDFVSNATQGASQIAYQNFSSFIEWYAATYSQGPPQVGYPILGANRLLSRALAAENPAQVAEKLLSLNGGVLGTLSVAGGAVSEVDPSSMSVFPAWRTAVAELYNTVTWPEGSPNSVIQEQVQALERNTEILNEITPDSASYMNEGSPYEKDFKKSFFGDHYTKLKDIKFKYDPASLFVVPLGVGSDEWDSDLRCPV